MSGATRRLAAAGGLALLVAYAAFLAVHASGVAAASDSSGYLNFARGLLRGEVTRPLPAPPAVRDRYPANVFLPLGYRAGARPGTMVPTYPAGLPLHLAGAGALVGLDAAGPVVLTAGAVALLLLVYALARELGLPRGWAIAACTLLAGFPVTVLHFTWLMSDGLAATWCTGAALAALAARRHAAWALGAGFALGVAVLVRPTNALLLPALLVALAWRPRALALLAVGGLPAAGCLAWLNATLYGQALATGYGGGITGLLSPRWVIPTLTSYGGWLARFLTPLLPALWAVGVWRGARGDRRQALLAAWALPFLAFYLFFKPAHETWWYLRFLLPALPAVVLAALLAARGLAGRVIERRPDAGRLVGAGLALSLAAALGCSLYWNRRFEVWRIAPGEESYRQSARWAAERMPPGAAVVCMQTSGALVYYTAQPIVRYDAVAADTLGRLLADLTAAGVPVYALPYEFELASVARLPGAWESIGANGRATLLRLNDPPR